MLMCKTYPEKAIEIRLVKRFSNLPLGKVLIPTRKGKDVIKDLKSYCNSFFPSVERFFL